MSGSHLSTTSSTSLLNGAATMRCGRYCFRTFRAGCSTPASAPELRVLSAGDDCLGDRYQPGHAGTGAPAVPDPVGGRPALPDGRYRTRVSGRLVRRGGSDIPVLCSAREEQLPALRELDRVVRPGGLIRLLEYVRPRGTLRRIVSRLWDPWIAWAYGASFDRQTERHVLAPALRSLRAVTSSMT